MSKRVVAVSLAMLLGLSCMTLAREAAGATLKLTVNDQDGKPMAFQVVVIHGYKVVANTWDKGSCQFGVPSGKNTVVVRHGFDYDAVMLDLDMPDGVTDKTVTLKKRFDVRSLGWYCGESHMHGQHGKRDKPQTFKDAERLGEAAGLDYFQIAQAWMPDNDWPSLETLQNMAKEASTPQCAMNWNMESPKCYMSDDDGGRAGNLHSYGHGVTLGLTERPYDRTFWFNAADHHPNFRIIQEIHRQKAVVMVTHPTRFWFNEGNFVSNWASELPFDYVTGNGYDGMDVLMDGSPVFFTFEHCWYNLLNMGYKVAATASTDGSIINARAGKWRFYTKISGDFSWEKIAQGIRDGATIASSGPMILFQVDGKDPGAEFPADGKVHKATLKAWSSPMPGDALVSVQVIRNGEVVQAWDLRSKKAREWSGELDISDTAYAWYSIRVTSTSNDPEAHSNWTQPADLYEVAVASAVYFLPEKFQRPAAAKARVTLNVTNESGKPVAASVSVVDMNKEVARETVDASGAATLTCPATALLVIKAPGYAEVKKDLYMDTAVHDFCRDFYGFYTPEGFNELRGMLGKLRLNVKLAKASSDK